MAVYMEYGMFTTVLVEAFKVQQLSFPYLKYIIFDFTKDFLISLYYSVCV